MKWVVFWLETSQSILMLCKHRNFNKKETFAHFVMIEYLKPHTNILYISLGN